MIEFIENKQVDPSHTSVFNSVSGILSHWSNFGPVSCLLESHIEQQLHLRDRKVVTTSSGTSALYALVGLKHYRAGRELRWAVPAFTFASVAQGPLRDAFVLDVDDCGLLSLDALRTKKDYFEAFVVCDYMGTMISAYPYVEFAKQHGKVVIFDCATGFDRFRDVLVDEAISFHHTKPWGFGEGGCVIVKPEDLHAMRSIVNCGTTRGEEKAAPWASNYKMSDVAAGHILAWLRSFKTRKRLYQENYDRIYRIAHHKGFIVIGGRQSTPGNVPLLMKQGIHTPHAEKVVVRKYYTPLADLPMAHKLWEHIANIPCHPEMNLTNEEIEHLLDNLHK